MKKSAMIAALIIVAAASNARTIEAQDTTINVGNKQIVMTEEDGATRLTLLDKKGKEMKKMSETTYIDDQEVSQIYVSSPFLRSSWERSSRKKFESHVASFYFGLRNMVNNSFSFNAKGNLHTKNSGSYEIGVGAFNVGIPFNKQNNIGLALGLQGGYTRLSFDNGHALFSEDGVAVIKPIESEDRIRKSYMSYWSMRVPVMLEYQPKLGRRDAFIGAGVSFEFRNSEHSRYKTKRDTTTPARDLSVNSAGINFEAYMGCDNLMLRFTTGLTPLFKDGLGPKVYTTSFGIGFCF